MSNATQTPAGRRIAAKVVVSMTEREYATWRRDHEPRRTA